MSYELYLRDLVGRAGNRQNGDRAMVMNDFGSAERQKWIKEMKHGLFCNAQAEQRRKLQRRAWVAWQSKTNVPALLRPQAH